MNGKQAKRLRKQAREEVGVGTPLVSLKNTSQREMSHCERRAFKWLKRDEKRGKNDSNKRS